MLPRGQIFYDAGCGLCSAAHRRFAPIAERRGFKCVPLQERRVRDLLNLEGNEVPDELKLMTRTGRLLGGVDALMYVARRVWWAWPVWLASQVPGVRPVMAFFYRRVARNRHRVSRACGFEPEQGDGKRAA